MIATCKNCRRTLQEAANQGLYFKRANPKGETPAEWVCAPSCAPVQRTNDETVLAAITDGDKDK